MALAAVFEVGGDALIRRGITGGGIILIALGFVVLGAYGMLVNLLGLDFTRMLGAYVGWFAVTSFLVGRFYFSECASTATWAGVVLVLVGSLVVQFGSGRGAPLTARTSPQSEGARR